MVVFIYATTNNLEFDMKYDIFIKKIEQLQLDREKQGVRHRWGHGALAPSNF